MPRPKKCPWYSRNVIHLINRKNNLHKKWKLHQSDYRWNLFKIARNKFILAVRTENRKYFNKPSLSTKILWRNIKELNICPKNKSHCGLDPDLLKDYFLF